MAKLVFMGTPQIAADILESILDAGWPVDMVVTQPDKKSGRKGALHACAVKQLAQARGIPVFQPEKIRADFGPIADLAPDLIITCAYGQIVPQALLDIPVHGCVNLHASLLPQYRGAAPIQRAIMDGKTQSAMALMKMEAGLDTGPVGAITKVDIDPEETSTTLFEKMAQAGSALITAQLPALLEGAIEFVPQKEEGASYAAKIEKEEEKLDLTADDQTLYNQMRGLARDPGGYVLIDGRKLKLLAMRYEPGSTPGKNVLDKAGKKKLVLGGHNGQFVLEEVQLEGKKPMKAADFLNGAGRSLLGGKAE